MGGCQPIMKEQPVSSKKEMSDNIFNKIMNSEGNGANNVPWQHNDTQDEKLRKTREELLGSIKRLDSSISQIKSEVQGLMNNYDSLHSEVEKVKENVKTTEIMSEGNKMKISDLTDWIVSISSNCRTIYDTCTSIRNRVDSLEKSANNTEFLSMAGGMKKTVRGSITIGVVLQRLRAQNVSDELASTKFLAGHLAKKGYIAIKMNGSKNHRNLYELVNCDNNPVRKNQYCRDGYNGLCEKYVIDEEYVVNELIPYFVKLQNHLDSFKDIGVME